jgi:type III secretory pathway component EscU
MEYELKKIDVKQSAKVLAAVALIINLFISVFGFIALVFGIQTTVSFDYIISISVQGLVWKIGLLLLSPILMFILAYLSFAVVFLLYNYVVKYTGGLKLHMVNADNDA